MKLFSALLQCLCLFFSSVILIILIVREWENSFPENVNYIFGGKILESAVPESTCTENKEYFSSLTPVHRMEHFDKISILNLPQ